MKTIVFIDETAQIGGAEINLIHILPRLKRAGWNPIVLVPEEGPLIEKLAACGVSCQIVPGGRFYSISSYIGNYQKMPNPVAWAATLINGVRWMLALKRVLREIQPDIVQTVSMLSHLFGGWSARKAGFPVIAHVQDIVAENSGLGLYHAIFQAWARTVPACIVCISPLVKHQFHNNLAAMKKMQMIWNMLDVECLDTRERSQAAHAQIRIGTVARLTPWKGQHVALKAAHLLMARDLNFQWQFVGDASLGEKEYARELFRQVEGCELKQRVDFLGWQEDTVPFYWSLDLLVHLPTEPEPFGLVIAEALSNGLPVVATHGGLDTIVLEAGGTVVPVDDAEAVATAIANIVTQPVEHRMYYRQHASSVALKYFSPREILPQWLQLYDEVMA